MLRFVQFGSLFLSEFLNSGIDDLPKAFREMYFDVKGCRRILRMYSGILNLRKILKYQDKDSKGFLKKFYILSKVAACTYFNIDTLKVFMYHFFRHKKKARRKIAIVGYYSFIFGEFFKLIISNKKHVLTLLS